MTDNGEKLENVVKDAYIIYFEQKNTLSLTAEEVRQRFEILAQRAEQLQQQYGIEKFTYKKFEFIPALNAVIKDCEIIKTLQGEGYGVKEQGKMTAL